MAYVAHSSDFRRAVPVKATATPLTTPRRGFWARLFDRLMEARRQDAEQAVAEYVARRGKLTDSIEREITDRLARNRF